MPVETCAVVENVALAEATYRVRVRAPSIASRIVPGQFVMLRTLGSQDPLLGRPYALYDVVRDAQGRPESLDIVYLVVGRGTAALSQVKAGDGVSLWGPLGNGFPAPEGLRHLVCVAGGIGQTPFLAVAREALGGAEYGRRAERVERVTLLYGVRSAARAACVADFRAAGVAVELASDDGSLGRRGFVTDLVTAHVSGGGRACAVYGCGPEPMLAALQRGVAATGVPTLLSLETPMACGVGICFSCVAKIRQQDGAWDYRRVCVDGPVFAAESIAF